MYLKNILSLGCTRLIKNFFLGVEAGKFLGFLLTEQGIEGNPGKCVTIIRMRSHATVKAVQ